MKPEHARVVAEFLCRTMESEIPTTIGVFNALPPNRLDYQPDPVSKTALGLMRHIVIEDEWILNAVADGAFGPGVDEATCGVMNSGDAVARYEKRIPAAIARIRAMRDDDLLKIVDLMGAWQQPAINFLSLAVRHSAHHRGQLSSYIRAMGGKVPSIYGPSADTVVKA